MQVNEVDQETLAKQAYEEIEAEKEGREPKDFLSTRKKDDEKSKETSDADDEQTDTGDKDGESSEGNKDEADKKDSEEGSSEDDKNSEDKSEDGDDQTDDKSDDEKSEDEDEGSEEDSEAQGEDKKISDYAQKHNMTYAEAKEDIEKTAEIIKQYKNDPAEMARAMRNKDREYHKLKAEADKAKSNKEPVFKRMTDEQFRNFARKKIAEVPEGKDVSPFIEAYRAKFPAKSESMSDEAIIEEMAERELLIYQERATKKEFEIKETASKKRESLIAKIPVDDRKFIPEIKALLSETEDAHILSDEFDIKDALYYAKGKSFDKEIKEAEARGYRRAKEGAQIVGTKPLSDGSKPAGGKKTAGGSLSDAQKKRALDMYGHSYDDETSYKMFRETFEEELKQNPKFVN